MIHSSGTTPPPFDVTAALNLAGHAEFLGIRIDSDGQPRALLRVCGIDIDFIDTGEADRFASAATVMANQLHIAHDRNHVNTLTPGGPA